MPQQAAIADHGVMFTEKPDHDPPSHNAAATGVTRASRPATAEVCFDRAPEDTGLFGGASYADVVGS